jgi:hypothetical protein
MGEQQSSRVLQISRLFITGLIGVIVVLGLAVVIVVIGSSVRGSAEEGESTTRERSSMKAKLC